MKYQDKLRDAPTKQSSNCGGYDPKFELKYVCPNCGRKFSHHEYGYKKLCCGTSIQKVT